MLRELVAAVEKVQIPVYGDDIAEAIGIMERLGAKVSEAVGAFDKAGIWEIEGASSMTAWLRHRARMSGGAAVAMTRTARRLRDSGWPPGLSQRTCSPLWCCGTATAATPGVIAPEVV